MKMKDLITRICKTEGKKLEDHVGNVREIMSILSDFVYKDYCDSNGIYNKESVVYLLCQNGKRRNKRFAKKAMIELGKALKEVKKPTPAIKAAKKIIPSKSVSKRLAIVSKKK